MSGNRFGPIETWAKAMRVASRRVGRSRAPGFGDRFQVGPPVLSLQGGYAAQHEVVEQDVVQVFATIHVPI